MKYIVYGAGQNAVATIHFIGPQRVECLCDSYHFGGDILDKRIISLDTIIQVFTDMRRECLTLENHLLRLEIHLSSGSEDPAFECSSVSRLSHAVQVS